jgi:hypothetical protein
MELETKALTSASQVSLALSFELYKKLHQIKDKCFEMYYVTAHNVLTG